MKKFAISFSIFVMLSAGVMTAFAATPNFSGTWLLDKTKSKDLPRQWENVESVTMTVTQDDKQLTVDNKIKRNENADQGGGRGMGMMGVSTFKLDGSENKVETTGERAMTSTFKAVPSKDGKTLELDTVRKGDFQGNEVTFTTKETWELSADGKTLTVNRSSESPRGSQSSTLVFAKQ